MARAIGVLFVLILISCSKKDPAPKIDTDEEFIQDYITTNSLTTTTTSEGVYRYEITENAAGNTAGDVFSIYYTLTDIRNNTQIDSHQAVDGDPIKLQNNAGAIFPLGLEYGIDGIKEGETYGLILNGALGYADYPTSAVANDAILLFEVEVVTRETEDQVGIDQGIQIDNYVISNNLNDLDLNPAEIVEEVSNGIFIKKTRILTGVSGVSPSGNDTLKIDFTLRRIDETPIDALDDFEFKFNSGTVISGLDIGLSEMELGEQATLFIPSNQAYGSSAAVLPNDAINDLIEQSVIPTYVSKVSPYEILIFDVTLNAVGNNVYLNISEN